MSERSSIPWRRLGVEMFAIVASVLLALAANEWWEGREDRRRAREAVVQFRTEIRQNRSTVAEALEYHRSMHERVSGIVSRVQAGGEYDPQEEGPPLTRGFHPPVLRGTAWRTAATTGALQELEYATVTRVSDAYTMQEVVTDQFHRILQGFMRPETFREEAPIGLLRFVLVSLNDIVTIEESLLEAYDRAVERLAEEPPGDSGERGREEGAGSGTGPEGSSS